MHLFGNKRERGWRARRGASKADALISRCELRA